MQRDRRRLVKRFIRNVHPCNTFYIPKRGWQRYGGDPRVIGFFADVYARRYASVWPEFVQLADGGSLGTSDGLMPYCYEREEPTEERSPVGVASSAGVAASYRFSRLCFKADIIESLREDDVFEIITPAGVLSMTKREFYRDFSNVVGTKSYREKRIYHDSTLPAKALRYRR